MFADRSVGSHFSLIRAAVHSFFQGVWNRAEDC